MNYSAPCGSTQQHPDCPVHGRPGTALPEIQNPLCWIMLVVLWRCNTFRRIVLGSFITLKRHSRPSTTYPPFCTFCIPLNHNQSFLSGVPVSLCPDCDKPLSGSSKAIRPIKPTQLLLDFFPRDLTVIVTQLLQQCLQAWKCLLHPLDCFRKGRKVSLHGNRSDLHAVETGFHIALFEHFAV